MIPPKFQPRKKRPVHLYSDEIRTLLENQRLLFYRRMKIQPPDHIDSLRPSHTNLYEWIDSDGSNFGIICPFGKIGDHLWVRETMWRNGGYVATDKSIIANEGKIPSVHMSRYDSRFTLDVIDIRAVNLRWGWAWAVLVKTIQNDDSL